MWNDDEDNNPYDDHRQTADDTIHHEAAVPTAAERPYTPLYSGDQQPPQYITTMDSPGNLTGRDDPRAGYLQHDRKSSIGSSFDHARHDDSYDAGSTRGTHAGTVGDNNSSTHDDDDEHDEDRDDLENIQVDEYGRAVGGFERTAGYGFQNRIQQILDEDPDLPILIVDAGKNVESGGSYIVYTIRTGDLEVRRRYSEFSSLRDVLVQLHPTLVVPPIPSKHSMADYAAKPTRAKEDLSIIDLRKRMLQVFLNRCRSMQQIRDDGVWWRFLDPNANWSEVLHSPPASLLPKNLLKAPPVNPWNPLPAHAWLPVPSTNARLKGTGTATSGAAAAAAAPLPAGVPHFTGLGAGATAVNANVASGLNSQAQSQAGAAAAGELPPGTVTFQSPVTGEFLPRFPPAGRTLTESELDPYFVNYEHSTKELENLLNSNIEKVNRRTLAHLSTLSTDLMELGARLNAFSLSESSRSLASAIEGMGQAFDRSYILTSELNSNLSATFAEPMRELAQFASVVRSVVRYRVLKRVQQEMTREELEKKRVILDSLERSEMEASRINQYLTTRGGVGGDPHGYNPQSQGGHPISHQRGLSTPDFGNPSTNAQRQSPSTRTIPERGDYRPTSSSSTATGGGRLQGDDASSIDSDFPAQHDAPTWATNPSAGYTGNGMTSLPPPSPAQLQPQPQLSHRKSSSMTGKLFGRISHAVHGFVDVDPEKTRRDQMGKTKESLTQLEQALKVSEKDVKLASEGVLMDLKRFQEDQEDDLRRYMVAYARCHLDWARKNLETWTEAKEEALKIDSCSRRPGSSPVTTSPSKRQKFHHRDGIGHPVSDGRQGHRRHRRHSRHHLRSTREDRELKEDRRQSHRLRPTSPPLVDREEKKEKERATDTESSRSKGRSEVGSSTPSTGSSGSRKERKNRDRGDRERERSRDREKEKEKEKDNRRERISREEIRRLQKRLGLSRADSAEFQTPAALRRQLRLEAKKKLKLKAALKETKRSDKTQRDRDDDEEDITRRDRKDKESSSSKSRSKSRSLKDRRHRTSHSARNSPQPEAPPSLPSSSAEPADPVSTKYRKPSAHTSSAVAHNRDSREEDKHSAVKPSSTRSSSSGSAKDHSKHLKSDRIEKESERIPVGKSGSTIPSPTIAVAKSSQFSPSRTTTTTTTPSTSKRSDHSSVKRRHSESHNHSHHHHHNHTHTHTHDADHRKEHHQLDSHHRRRKQHKHKHTSSAHDQDTPSIDESFESRSNTTSPQRSHKSTTRSSKKMSDKRVESGEDVSPINSQSGVSNQTNTSESSSDKMEGIEPTNTETTSSAPSNLGGVESHLLPSIDIQIQQVMDFVQRPIAEFQKGYLVSSKWLNRVLARSNDKTYLANKTIAKDATEGEIGPIDNSDLVLDAPQLKGIKHTDGQEYIPLKPNLTMGVDFEVLPEDAWHLIVRWYGVKPGTPVIVREAHNTAVDTTTMENIQYELRPPVFTVLKLSHTPTTACGSDRAPVMVVASRHMSFNSWLKCVKQKAGIPISTKVRVWRIIKNDVVTASTPSSRSSTPAPDNSNNLPSSFKTNLVVPVTAFKSLEEDSQRELLDAKDQTANEKYNGKASVDQYGLGGEEETIVLEEQLGGKVWCTEVSAAKAAHFTGAATPGVPTGKKDKGDDSSSSGTKVNSRSDSSSANSNNSGNSGPVKSHKELRKEEKEKRKQKEKEKESSGIRRRKDGKTVGVTGLVNLGNTCYMNSALQCIRSVEELTRYFLADNYKGDLNPSNPLGHDGNVARAYANLLHQIFDVNASSAFAPRQFKNVIGRYGPSFSGYGQQDSQEFIMFLLDGLQEDLNRIQKKPYIEKPDSTDDMVNNKAKLVAFAEEHWRIYKARNDSVVTDLFAGMYKSTLHCPECDKVSIIFDPFSNLTLQLPIENTWSHNLTFFPLYGKPISMDIEIEKNSTVKALKAHVAKKLGMPEDAVSRLIFTEVYNSRFYRMFDNQVSLADAQIESSDEVAMFEVESVPTSYSADFHRANQGYRSMLFSSRRDEDAQLAGDFKSPKGDRILVPIYNRVLPPKSNNNYARPTLKGHPGYVVINREEAYDYDAILKKVLACVANLTTRDILGEAAAELENEKVKGLDKKSDEMDTDDAVDLGAEMTEDNGDDKVKAESIKSEDGIVDVSMTDAPSSKTTLVGQIPYVCRPGVFVPGALQNIFEMRYHQSNEACPTSIGNEAQNFRSLTSRLPRSRSSSRNSSSSRVGRQQGPASLASPSATDDEATRPTLERTTTITHSEVGSDSDSGKTMPVDEKDRASSSASNRSNSTSRSRSGSRFSKFRRALKEKKDRPRVPLIRPGEAIILDWTDEVFDALFGASRATKDGLRGSPTWVNPEVFDDPELKAKRIQRRRLRNHGITLDDCLDEFGREEILSENDAWYCPRCKTHRRASKKFELWRTPDILVMHLKRFSSNRILRDKLDTFVDFPHELDMSDRVVHPEPGKSQKYELIAVDNHYGGLGGGHYTAYAKNFIDGNWYDFNDSSVHRIEPSKAVTRSAYLLFYRRKSEKPLGGPILEEMVTRSRMENDSSSSDSESDDSTSNRGSNSRHGGISLSRNVSSKFSPNSYSLDPILCLGPFRREEAVNAQRRQRFNLRLPGQGYEQAHGSLLDGDIAQPYSPKMPGSYISPPSIIEGDEQEFPMVKKRARAPEIFGPTFLGDEPDPDDGTTKHDQAYQQDVKSSDGSSSSTALTTTATTPPTPPPFPTKPSRIYNPKQRDIVEHAHHAHAHPRRNTSPDSNLITPSAQAKQIPGLDRENIVLPKSSGVPMVRSTASIGVPAKVEGGSDDRSPLRDLTSTPTWSFSKSLSSPAGMVDSNIASDAQDTSDIPGSFPTKEVNDDDMKKEGGLKEPTYDHVLNDMAADDDSDDEMPTQELEI